MSEEEVRRFSREFKMEALSRMAAGESVTALSRELGVVRGSLYHWRARFLEGGAEALQDRGRVLLSERLEVSALRDAVAPGEGDWGLSLAQRRIAELERKVGQQALELDFFRQALRRIKGSVQPGAWSGGTASTRSSKR